MSLHPRVALQAASAPSPWCDENAIANMTPSKARTLERQLVGPEPDLPEGVAARTMDAPGAESSLRARLYFPVNRTPQGLVLWIRGGGFVVGSLETERLPGPLAAAAGCAVLSFEYRLAPEHPFPAALDDCYAVLEWAHANAMALGIDGPETIVAGDSAGGNLATAVALLARERRGPPLALQVLIYPMLARHFDAPARRDPGNAVAASAAAIEWFWAQYLGDRFGDEAFACPLAASNLRGLPPALIVSAEYDVLRDDATEYARRLRRDSVPAHLSEYPGMPHGFADQFDDFAEAQDCLNEIATAIRNITGRPT